LRLESIETPHLFLQLLDLLLKAPRFDLKRLGTVPAGRRCRVVAKRRRESAVDVEFARFEHDRRERA
jgi:hypothetical protein